MPAINNALRYSTDLIKGVRRAFGLGAEDDGLERLGETLDISADPFLRPEWAWLRDEGLFAIGLLSAAAAGVTSYVQLKNPTTSGILVVLEKVFLCDSAAANAYFLGMTTLSSVAGVRGWIRDSRQNPGLALSTGATSLALVAQGSDMVTDGVGTVANGLRFRTGGNGFTILDFPVVLHPGNAFTVWDAAVNTAVNAGFMWRERRPYPGELPR